MTSATNSSFESASGNPDLSDSQYAELVEKAQAICGRPEGKLPKPIADKELFGDAADSERRVHLLNKILENDVEGLRLGCASESDTEAETLKLLTIPDKSGNTPLIWAADSGSLDVVRFLLDKLPEAAIFHRGFLGNTILIRAMRCNEGEGSTEMVRLFLEKLGSDKFRELADKHPNDKLQYAMHHASFHAKGDILKVMLDHGCSTWVKDRKGRTPLEDCRQEEIKEMIRTARDSV